MVFIPYLLPLRLVVLFMANYKKKGFAAEAGKYRLTYDKVYSSNTMVLLTFLRMCASSLINFFLIGELIGAIPRYLTFFFWNQVKSMIYKTKRLSIQMKNFSQG